MSYTIFDRMCDAVDEELECELDRDVIERIWDAEIDPILDRFSEAQKRVWAEIEAVIAKHGGGDIDTNVAPMTH